MLVRVLHSNLTSYYHPEGHYVGESTALKPESYYHPEGHYVGESTALKPDVILPP